MLITIRIALLVALTTFLTAAVRAQAQPKTLDQSCRVAFEALRANDYGRIEATFPKLDEFKSIIDASPGGGSTEERAARLEARGGYAGLRTKMLAKGRKRFERDRARAARAFDWKQARFVAALPLVKPARPIRGTAYAVGRVEFLVWADEKLWSFGGNDVLSGPRGWAFVEFLSFHGRRPRADEAKSNRKASELENQLRAADAELQDVKARLDRTMNDARRLENELQRAHSQGEALGARCGEMEHERDRLRREVERAHGEAQRLRVKVEQATERLGAAENQRLELESRLADARSELEGLEAQLASHRDDAKDQAQGAAQARQQFGLERDALRIAVRRLEKPSKGGALATPITAEFRDVEFGDVIRFVRTATGAKIVVLPQFRRDAFDRKVMIAAEREPAMRFLTRVAGDGWVRTQGDVVFIGAAPEIQRLGKSRLGDAAADGTAEKALRARLRQARLKLVFESMELSESLQVLQHTSGVNLWWSQAVEEETSEFRLDASVGLPVHTLLNLMAQDQSLVGILVDNTVILRLDSAKPATIPDLDRAVVDKLPAQRSQLHLDDQSVEDRAAALSALYGVKIRVDPAAVQKLEDALLRPLHLDDATLHLALRLTAFEVGPTAVWTRDEAGLTLTLRK